MSYIFYYYIVSTLIHQTYCSDANITELEQLTSDINDFDLENAIPTLDVSEYIIYLKSYHLIWNNYNEWTWNSSHNNSINTTTACSKTLPFLCINSQFSTDPITKQLESLKSLRIYHSDDMIASNNIALDFWNDLDWSQVNILHHNDPNEPTDRRQLLRGTLSSKYGQEYYYYDDDEDALEVAAEMQDESQIDSMQAMNDYLFDQDDDMADVYNMEDYYKYSERMSAAQWGVFKKIWKGIKKGARAIGNRIGIYARPPCRGSSRCRVHVYNKRGFRKRANKKGHFCEGKWDRWRLHKYRVNRRKISSIKVQGSPCCVVIAYNGNKFDGDEQAMFPRGRYRNMRMGLSTSMGMGDGMNGMGGGGMMGMMGGGMGMMGAGRNGFRNRALASMKIVHDCHLRQILMRRAMGRHGMWGGMHGGMGGGMGQLMQMMMMMKMMFPKHKGRRHTMCRYYSCIVKTQQSQLQQLTQMMMMGAMAKQAPITISDNTKRKPGGRRRMVGMGGMGMGGMDIGLPFGMGGMGMGGMGMGGMGMMSPMMGGMGGMGGLGDMMGYGMGGLGDNAWLDMMGYGNPDNAYLDMMGYGNPMRHQSNMYRIFGKRRRRRRGKRRRGRRKRRRKKDYMQDGGQFGKMGFPSLSGNMMGLVQSSKGLPNFMKIPPTIHINAEFRRLLGVKADGGNEGALLSKCVVAGRHEICAVYNLEHKSIAVRYIVGDMYVRKELDDMDDGNVNENDFALMELNIWNEWYGIWRNWLMFEGEDGDFIGGGEGLHDFKKVVWSDMDMGNGCNDLLLSFVNYTICVEEKDKDFVIYFKNTESENENEQHDIDGDITKMVKLIYKESRLSISNEMDWNEIYRFEKSNIRRLCTFMPIIKLCATMDTDGMRISEISVQFVSIAY